jgi:putative FmdB family regulatory protein
VPTYQYACTACGERLEAVQSFTDAPLTECPACSGALRKVFSAVGVVFKGSGFYKTDSRSAAKSGSSSTSESTSSGDASASSSSGSSDSSSSSSSSGSTTPSTSSTSSTSSTPASKSA